MSKQKIAVILLSGVFVFLSFFPSLYEIYSRNKLPADRVFTLDHNYMFDYNFYLSRIREGQEGKWMVVEKYYSEPHKGSLLQIFYLILGKIGGLLGFTPPWIYHLSRLVMGFILLMLVGLYINSIFSGRGGIITFLLILTSGSWPILVRVGNFWRFATHMGYWSVIDSLQRITFIPHILLGQIGILLFVWVFGQNKPLKIYKLVIWGIAGFIAGIIFPPTLIVIYTILAILSVWELAVEYRSRKLIKKWLMERGFPRAAFCVLSFPSLIYLNFIFMIPPWSALALFDIEHRIPIPYNEYFLALGPVLPLGLAGLVTAFIKREKRLYPVIAWVAAVFLLFRIFENIPQQSPSRFTEAAIFIPLGILTGYFLNYLSRIRYLRKIAIGTTIIIILMGFGVMLSMEGWLTDQVRWKREATYQVPIGAQLAYPLKDFMKGIYYIRDNTNRNNVVLGYITAGNYIPAYAGNFVFIGHANTPDEDGKEKVAARFFKGEMGAGEAREFLGQNHISYVYFGPAEKELGNIEDLSNTYMFLNQIYRNDKVIIFKVGT